MDKEQILEFLSTDEGKEVLNTVNAGLLAKRDELLSKQVSLKSELDKFKSLGVEPDALPTILQEYNQLKNSKKDDKPSEPTVDPKLLAQLEHFKTELSARDQKLNALQTKLVTSALDSVVMGEIAKADGIPMLLKPLIASRIKTELDDNAQVKITVLNEDGTPKFKGGKEATVEDLINELKASEDFAGAFKVKPVSGSGTRATAGKPTVAADPSDANFNLTSLMKKKR